jgi:hypothetical protein
MDFKELLGKRESDGDYYNDNGSYWGKYQLGTTARKFVANKLGIKNPNRLEFTPELQEKFFEVWYSQGILEINNAGLYNFIGNNIVGKSNKISSSITIEGLFAGWHLGGINNLKKLLLNKIDTADNLGTYISDYVAKFSKLEKKN